MRPPPLPHGGHAAPVPLNKIIFCQTLRPFIMAKSSLLILLVHTKNMIGER